LVRLCIDLDLDEQHIKGHREMPSASTECPGMLFDLDALRRDVAKHLSTVKAVILGMDLWKSKNNGTS